MAADEELTEQLDRLPDLSKALREAPPAIKRQVFASFDLQIAYDKAQHRVELTATVSEAVADAFENADVLLADGSTVVVRDIAGARFVARYDARIVERARLPTASHFRTPTRKDHSWMTCCPLLLRMKQEYLGDAGAFERGIESLNRRDVEAIALDPTPTDFYLT